jgi:hypothetical protein
MKISLEQDFAGRSSESSKRWTAPSRCKFCMLVLNKHELSIRCKSFTYRSECARRSIGVTAPFLDSE